MNGTPTFRSLADLFVFLRSPEMRLDIPLYYSSQAKEWLDILNRLRTPSQRPPDSLPELARWQVNPLAGPAELYQAALQDEPDEELQQIAMNAPGPLEEILRLLQAPQPPAAPRYAAPQAINLEPLLRQRRGDTVFYGNTAALPWPWRR